MKDKMIKKSLYMPESEWDMLDAARENLVSEMGVRISGNSYIRSLLFGLVTKVIENSPESPTNPLQTAD